MATLPPLTYALDPTGTNPDNLVSGEVHVMPARQKRVIAPDYGGYYTDSLVVVEQSTGNVLVRNTHYECIEMFSVPSARFGKQVCGLVLLTDANVTSPVQLTYQAVGGEYSKSLQALKQLIENLQLDTRPASWPEIIGRPEEFPPAHHLHDVGDVYGFETFVHALERIRRAIELGDTVTHDAVYRYIDQVMIDHPNVAAVAALIATAMNNHMGDANPHPQYQQQIPEVKKPVILSPTLEESVGGRTPTLLGSDYKSLYGSDHASTQFQIATNPTFSAGLWNSPTLGPVTSYDTPAGVLNAATTYYVRVRYASVEGVYSPWSDPAQFATGSALIAQPSVLSPANGATNQSLTPTLTCSAFAMSQGVDTHDSTEWEIGTQANGAGSSLWNSGPDSLNLTSIVVPSGILVPSTQYHYRARQRGNVAGVSAFSTSKMFTTAAAAPTIPPIGQAYGGGFVAGYFRIGTQRYVLIVAPVATGFIASQRFSEHYHNYEVDSQSFIDGRANTLAQIAASQGGIIRYPAALWAASRVIGGFSDWYIPARDELEILYRYLKPTTDLNKAGTRKNGSQMGENAYSDPIGAAYTTNNPAITAAALFVYGAEQALAAVTTPYMSSTREDGRDNSHTNFWVQTMRGGAGAGAQQLDNAVGSYALRLVRRVAVPG